MSGPVAFLPVIHTAAVMVPGRPGSDRLNAGASVVSGTAVHPCALHHLQGDEQGHDQHGDEGTERPRGTGQHSLIIQKGRGGVK